MYKLIYLIKLSPFQLLYHTCISITWQILSDSSCCIISGSGWQSDYGHWQFRK